MAKVDMLGTGDQFPNLKFKEERGGKKSERPSRGQRTRWTLQKQTFCRAVARIDCLVTERAMGNLVT